MMTVVPRMGRIRVRRLDLGVLVAELRVASVDHRR